ncbi:parapinopsin-like [Corythoichthys intestinalis]|uniref:parapinopsin-like n=1 Tax=Corythoichthys intestinalis TaxID=161448 RepID=UPI0025A547D5|nr:parapinopsin-like [Corythoichthys intestinalis]XP_061814312.1 parapinopsin-like [Nerophis lumbriciformis]
MHHSFFTPNSSMYLGPHGEPLLSRTGFILLSVVMALFTGPAILLNATVIIVSLMHKQLRQPLNYALVNMAVADLGTAMTGGLLSVVNNAQGYFSLGRTGCVMEGFAVSLFGITSLCTVALIAVERMFVICKPLGQIAFQKKHAIGGIALSWLWSLTWNVPPLLGWGRYELEGVGTSCAPDWHNRDPHNVSYILCYFALCFALPFAVILVSYTKLLWMLHQVSKMACVEGGAVAKAEMRVAAMVIIMVLTFLINWLPYACLSMLVVYNPHVEINPLVATMPVYLAKSSTVYNPIIYIYCNKQFRKYAVPFLLCGKKLWLEDDDASEAATVVEMTANKVLPA